MTKSNLQTAMVALGEVIKRVILDFPDIGDIESVQLVALPEDTEKRIEELASCLGLAAQAVEREGAETLLAAVGPFVLYEARLWAELNDPEKRDAVTAWIIARKALMENPRTYDTGVLHWLGAADENQHAAPPFRNWLREMPLQQPTGSTHHVVINRGRALVMVAAEIALGNPLPPYPVKYTPEEAVDWLKQHAGELLDV